MQGTSLENAVKEAKEAVAAETVVVMAVMVVDAVSSLFFSYIYSEVINL